MLVDVGAGDDIEIVLGEREVHRVGDLVEGVLRHPMEPRPFDRSVVDVHTPIDGILERFAGGGNLEEVLVNRDMIYIGFLSAASRIRIIN